MVKLIFGKKIILPEMRYVAGVFGLLWGLMFASESKIKRGMCLDLSEDKKASIHMLFCFYPYEVLFVNSKLRVVDKKVLRPWSLGYEPAKKFKYAIESWNGTFKGIKVGDKIKIQM